MLNVDPALEPVPEISRLRLSCIQIHHPVLWRPCETVGLPDGRFVGRMYKVAARLAAQLQDDEDKED